MTDAHILLKSLRRKVEIEMFLSAVVIFAILESLSLLHGELICFDSTLGPFYALPFFFLIALTT